MSSATNYLESAFGNHLLRDTAFPQPTTIAVALFTVMPAEDGTGGTEVTGGDYARVTHGPGDASWSAPVAGDGVFSNASSIVFAPPTANWGTVLGFGLYDATTAGNLLIKQTLTAPVIVNSGDPPPAFAIGALTITFA